MFINTTRGFLRGRDFPNNRDYYNNMTYSKKPGCVKSDKMHSVVSVLFVLASDTLIKRT